MNSEPSTLKSFHFQTTEITTKSFTTARKKTANSPVRKRCLEFVDAMHSLGYSCMPLDDAKELFIATLQICDRTSVKAYFGTQPHRVVQPMERMARYASGVNSLERIELSHKVGYTAGYFELLRLATIQKKGSTWFMVLNEVGVVSQLGAESLMEDCANKSNVEISLSAIRVNEQLNGLANDGIETDREEREYRVRERKTMDFAHTICRNREI